MGRRIAAMTAAFALVFNPSWAGCDKPADAMALQTAAVQQELMVAALVCKSVAAYNHFVLSHQAALQKSDKALLAFFTTADPQRGFDDYNLYKTELANHASLRSMHDGSFCERAKANFHATQGHSLEHALARLPYPVETGPFRCRLMEAAKSLQAPAADSAKERLQRSAEAGR